MEQFSAGPDFSVINGIMDDEPYFAHSETLQTDEAETLFQLFHHVGWTGCPKSDSDRIVSVIYPWFLLGYYGHDRAQIIKLSGAIFTDVVPKI